MVEARQSKPEQFQESTRPTLIELSNLTYAYHQGCEVFKNASLQIVQGDLCYITGPSGIGKSTFLKLIYGALKSYLGSIKIFDRELRDLGPGETTLLRQNIGIIFQEFLLLEHLSVLDNVIVPLVLQGVPLEESRERGSLMLSWLGLGSHLSKMPLTLSGGERQRIAIARALVPQPPILLADEPTGHVDDENAALIMELFSTINRQGTAVLMATHNREIMEAYPGYAFEISDGKFESLDPVKAPWTPFQSSLTDQPLVSQALNGGGML